MEIKSGNVGSMPEAKVLKYRNKYEKTGYNWPNFFFCFGCFVCVRDPQILHCLHLIRC